MLLLIAVTLALMVVGVATSAASGADVIGSDYCSERGVVAIERGAGDLRGPLSVQQHEPQDSNVQVTGREPVDEHC
jgi:hypothetical protein